LKERPSFTTLATIAAADHGAVVKQGSNTRGTTIETNPDKMIEALAASMVAAIAKIKGAPSDRQSAALKTVQSAIVKVLAQK
jgi:hypothetical protein